MKNLGAIATLLLALAPGSALAGPPRCFLHGIIKPITDPNAKGEVTDMLRMNFDVKKKDERAKCEQMLTAYCTFNVRGKDYSPARLKAIWNPDIETGEAVNFTFNEKCKLIED